MDQMHDEELGFFEPRPWHQDRPQRPKVWGDDTLSNWWGPMSHSPNRTANVATKQTSGSPDRPARAEAAAALAQARIGNDRKRGRRPGKSRR
jgi:hypothetical protein